MLTNITGYLSSYFEGVKKKEDSKNESKEPSNLNNYTSSIMEDLSDDDIVILAKPNEYWGDDEGNSEENNEEDDKDNDEEKDENTKSEEDENAEDTDIDDISISSEGELVDMVVGYDDIGSSDSLNDYEYVDNTYLNNTIQSHTNRIHILKTTTNKILIPNIKSSNSKQDDSNFPHCHHITPNRQIPSKHSNKRRRQTLLKETTPENSDFESYRGPYFNFHKDLWGDQEILTDASDQPEIMSSPSFEESWLVTPAPCFDGTDLVKMVKGSMEDLLLKGPTVSVYQKFFNQKDNKISGGSLEGRLGNRMGGCDDKMASDYGEEGSSEGRYNSCVEENEDETVPADECDVRTEENYTNQMDCKYDSDDANVACEEQFYSKDIFEINENSQKDISNGEEWPERYDTSLLKLEMINDSEESYFENPLKYNLGRQMNCLDSGFNSWSEGIIDLNYIYNINHQTRNSCLLSCEALSLAFDGVLKSSGYNGRGGEHSIYQISDLVSFRSLTPTESLMVNEVTTLSKNKVSSQTIINLQSPTTIVKEKVFKSEFLCFLNMMRFPKRKRNLHKKCKTNSFKKINNNHHHVKKNYHPYHSHHYQRAL